MKRQLKTITPEMLRRRFGSNARIAGSGGCYRVATADGGEVKIRQGKMTAERDSSDMRRGCVLLAGEAWGGGKISGGESTESKLVWLAHGSAAGVDMRLRPGGGFARGFVAFLVAWVGISYSGPGVWPCVWLVVGGVLWLLMRRGAKRKAEKEAEQLGYRYPRVGSGPRGALREDAEREGYL